MNAIKLRELRTGAILTQSELAKLAGVSLRTVAALEAGNQSAQPRTIRALAKALRVKPQELVAGSER